MNARVCIDQPILNRPKGGRISMAGCYGSLVRLARRPAPESLAFANPMLDDHRVA